MSNPPSVSSGCGADALADHLKESLLAGENLPDLTGSPDFSEIVLPKFGEGDFSAIVKAVTLEDLTDGKLNGKGDFDGIMRAIRANLQEEFQRGRLTGGDYAQVMSSAIVGAMAQGIQFTLNKEQSQWQGLMVKSQAFQTQVEAMTAQVQFEIAKLSYQTSLYQAKLAEVEVAKGKLELTILDTEYCIKKFQKEEILPVEKANLVLQGELLEAQVISAAKDVDVKTAQISGMTKDNEIKTWQLTNLYPAQLALLREQADVQRAQIRNTLTDGTQVAGVLGVQKELYGQQKISYERDSQVKAAKLFIDSWVTQKTMDEGLTAPGSLNNSSVDTVMNSIKSSHGLT